MKLLLFASLILAASALPSTSKLRNAGPVEDRTYLTPKVMPKAPAHRAVTKPKTFRKGWIKQDVECGFENDPHGNGRIVGGSETLPNQFPWVVWLRAERWSCTASLISDQWVLTAAHCVDGSPYFDIYIGTHDHTDLTEEHQRIIHATNAIYHEDWNHNTLENDIAVIKLPSPIEFNDYVKPSCLPTRTEAHDDLHGETVTATGWGKLQDSSTTAADKLHYVSGLPVLSNYECKAYYPGLITKGHLCIDSSGGHGVCNGDSGGPLNYRRSNKQFMTVGVASFVSSKGCESGIPHGFTRVTEYLDWIETTTGIIIDE